MKNCNALSCENKANCYDLCHKHYARWKRLGDPNVKVRLVGHPYERFMSFVHINQQTGCWEWQGYVKPAGYPFFSVKKKTIQAHRWAYEYFKKDTIGPLTIDHLCRVKHCVNPDHLEKVTIQENLNRRLVKQCCPHGHDMKTFGVVYERKQKGKKILQRVCKICSRRHQKEFRERIMNAGRSTFTSAVQ